MASISSWTTVLLLILPSLTAALPFRIPTDSNVSRGLTLPIERRRIPRDTLRRRDDGGLAGSVGIGDLADLFYTVSIQAGSTQTSVNLDTGSSDLWVMSDACQTDACQESTANAYKASSGQNTGASVNLLYGDSTTGTHATGPVVLDSIAVAGLSMPSQAFAAVNDTNNSAVQNGGAGIFGLGFPSQSFVQAAVVNNKFNTPSTTDEFVNNIASYGPLVSRLASSGHIEQPLFAITLQRNTIDVGGKGQITVGELPQGVDNSSLTWVPVRLYAPKDGGLNPPSFAQNEVYPLRWEIPLDGVYLDGNKLPDTKLTGTSSELSALIDTGNSLLRGPQDVVNDVLTTVSPGFTSGSSAQATFPCSTPHTVAFQIGGKMFPVDPRDFISSDASVRAKTCSASNLVQTDPPSSGALFSWSLGDPFFKSNLVVFYYGNLTHPSVDPPRIGFMSTVPQNATALLQEAVEDAQQDGGVFESTVNAAPTASSFATVSAASVTSLPASASASSTSSPTPGALQAQVGSSASPSSSAVASPSPSGKKNAAIAVTLPFYSALGLVVLPLLSLLSHCL